MEQLKNSLGPFELFSAIIGGSPFILAGFLIYNPVKSLADLAQVIQTSGASSGALAIALTVLFLSYIIGGSIQSLSWKYFVLLCNLLNQKYAYFDDRLIQRLQTLNQSDSNEPSSLDFEDRLALKLQETIGVPKKLSWLDNRLEAYLRERKSPAVGTAETYVASHIMYRNLSLGCLILVAVGLINSIRSTSLELLLLTPFIGYLAYLMFLRAVSFKRWQSHALVLGFYFVATKESGD